jgi:uncharacterized protein (DUF4415 family)
MPRKLIPPAKKEDEKINRGIASDPDNPEWTDEDFARARPAKDVLPPELYEALVKRGRKHRRKS